VTGSFYQLCKDFNEESDWMKDDNYEYKKQPKKIYKKPVTNVITPTDKVDNYLKLRGFSKETCINRKIGSDEKDNIVMPYYENGELVLVKFRPSHKIVKKNGDIKSWREEGGKPVFWGMDDCNVELPLILCEGEMDALALDEAGIKNVVSVPSGCEDLTCVELCWDWLEKFKKIIIWGDSDAPGQEMVRKLINRLGEYRCSVVNSNRKDANEVLYFDGKNKIIDAISNAKEVPIAGLLRLSDVENFDYSKVERVSSGFELIDKAIGGFMMGQVSLWTGSNSSGKSTLLGQILVESIEKDFNVCAFSGELPAPLFKYWVELQMAGKLNLKARYDELKKEDIYFVPDNIKDKMKAWYRDRFFLYDSFGSAKGEDILKIFEYAARRYDCKVFSIDNLMITDFCSANKDFYRAQSEFMGKIIEFTHKFNVHVHVVAHPRKTSGDITKNDVGGSGDLTNRVDNVFSVSRIDQDDPKNGLSLMDCDNKVDILKNRFSGRQDITIGLKFEPLSKRFFAKSDIDSDSKRYGWNDQQTLITEVQMKSPWDGDEE
jgi:twinkle protein